MIVVTLEGILHLCLQYQLIAFYSLALWRVGKQLER